jgi:hypothetical protein
LVWKCSATIIHSAHCPSKGQLLVWLHTALVKTLQWITVMLKNTGKWRKKERN